MFISKSLCINVLHLSTDGRIFINWWWKSYQQNSSTCWWRSSKHMWDSWKDLYIFIFIQWQLSISFQSWIRLIWTWIIKSRNNNNQMITSFSRLWRETCRWLGSNWLEMLRDKGLIFKFLQRNLIQSLFSVCQTECHPLNNWFYKMWLRMLFHIT